jgi:DNA-binding LacI/PurR family transcriptional regulator
MRPQPRPRLVDLADRLNVAPSTVSRALAGSKSVSAATRKRVIEVARDMGYSVNPVASGLKRGQTSSIGLIAVMSYWYSGAVTSGSDRVAAAHDYDFVVMNAVGGIDREVLIQRARRLGQRVDGALAIDIREGELLEDLIDALGVPVVTIGCQSPSVSAVLVDNEEIARQAAAHLRSLGHQRAAALWPQNPSPLAFDNALVRADAFTTAFGSEGTRRQMIPSGASSTRRGVILEAATNVSAIFCATDALAIETIATLRDAGRPVPDDVSVIGVDDHPLAEALGLTTIAQEPEAMGELATAMVIAAAQGKGAPREVVEHGVRLVARRTSGSFASGGLSAVAGA